MLKYMTIADACKATGGKWCGDDSALNKRITDVVTDSRKAGEGTLFVAIAGERVDGHNFIPQVLENGAVAALSEKEIDNVKDYILVDNTVKAFGDLAAFYRKLLDIKVVGITGSVGKTSTKEMIAAVLGEKYRVQKTAGNFNNDIGVPITVFTITEEHEIAVTEMGISGFGEMDVLSKITRPDIMVITNIGECHLENLGTRDGVLKAKTECFANLNQGARVVLNGDDDKLITVERVQEKAPCFFGKDDTSYKKYSVYATDIVSLGLAGSEATIHVGSDEVRVCIPIAGSHMVMNALAATQVGLLLGMSLEEIASGIAKCQAVAGRGKLTKTEKYLLVDDTYNANPVSMKAELDLLAQSNGRRVAILGDMFELGLNENEMHYEVGEYAAKKSDVLVCIGKLSKNMYEGACKNGGADIAGDTCDGQTTSAKASDALRIYYFEDKESFLAEKDNILNDGDTILLKASHGMHFEELFTFLLK